MLIALCVLAPAPILVDHGARAASETTRVCSTAATTRASHAGHFQYNCLPLGLTLWSALFIDERPYLASLLFTLALHSKQTALYYAPAVFCELLGRNLEVTKIVKLGAVVLGTSFVLWLPLLMEGASLQALKRCFPVARGVFEDKVGNAWYAAQVFLRARDRLDQSSLIKVAAASTALCSFAPCLLRCRRVARGQDRSLSNILRSLHVSALAFFLFSYHVHEKGILVPLYPLLPLSLAERDYAAAFSLLSAFTLLPLLHYEGLALAYGASVALYVLAWYDHKPRRAFAAFAGLVPLHFMPLVVPPPARYPDLYPALVALSGAAGFGLAYVAVALHELKPWRRGKLD